jgi:hypothetical protein
MGYRFCFCCVLLFLTFTVCELGVFDTEFNVQLDKISNLVSNSDGTYYAFIGVKFNLTTHESVLSLYVQPTDSLRSLSIPHEFSNIKNLVFTPHPKILSFFSDEDDGTNLILYNVTSHQFKVAYKFGGIFSFLKWSSEGSFIVASGEVYPRKDSSSLPYSGVLFYLFIPCFVLFCFVLFCFILFCFVSFCFCFVLFYFILFCSESF